MTIAEVKNDLILKVLQTHDPALLSHLANYFQKLLEKKDWWDDLSDRQQILIERSSSQIETGQILAHASVRAEIDTILNKN